MTDDKFREMLAVAFEHSYLHDSWVHPLSETLAVWNENIAARIESGSPVHPPEGAWPEPAAQGTEDDWSKAQQRLWASLESVRRIIDTAPITGLMLAPYGPADLLCRFTHNAYHIGQITKMREALRSP